MNWLKKYQQGGSTYNPGGETSLKGINMYNPQQVTNPNMSLAEGSQPDPWAINNPNSQETMDDVYAGRDKKTQTPENQSYLKTTTKSTFGTPNWQYIQTANMIGDGLGFLAQQRPNSSQNAMKRYNDQKLDPLNTLMANPNTSAQDQAGSGYYKMGGWISKYQDGGSIDDEDEEYLFGLDDNEEQEETPEVTYSKRKNLQSQYAQEDQENMMRQMQQEAFFSSLVNTDPDNQSNNYSQYNNSSFSNNKTKNITDYGNPKSGNPYAKELYINLNSKYGVGNLGIWGDKSHQQRKSDHNTGDAIDLSYKSEEDRLQIIEDLKKDSNVKYIISKGKIWNPSVSNDWRPNKGHDSHIHVSLNRPASKSYQQGGIIDDPMGQWSHPGEVTRIPSPDITMKGVLYPVLGISNTGDTQMMQPNQDYSFDGESVTEYPIMQKGGSVNWIDSYKQVADNNSSRYIPKTVEEYNQLNPNLKEQEFLASHPTQQFIPYVTPTSTYHKEAIDNKKKEIERILFTNEGRHSDGEYKFLRKPRPELNKWVDQIGLPVLEGASLIGGVGEGYQLLKATGKLGRLGLIKSLGKDILEKPSNVLKNNKVVQGVDNTLTAVGNRANVLGLDPVGAMIDHQVKGLNTAVNVNWMWDNNTRQYVPNFNGSAINVAGKYTSDLYDGIGPDKVTSPLNTIRDLNVVKGTINSKGQPFPVGAVGELKPLSDDMMPKLIDKVNPDFNTYQRVLPNDVLESIPESSLDWGKWNKEIPDNKALMQEYNSIEQQAKANGTWMKNPDGSKFQGTPEQFVQQNSENFKKAFPEGSENVFRGTGENIAELRPNRSTFTANQELASGYAPFNKKSNFLNSESVEGGVHSFYRKNSKNSLELDVNNTSWTSVDLSNKRLTKDYFERNIKSQEDQITKQKEYLSKMKQYPNGSWEAPDGTIYSNDLYKNTVAERELYLKDLKERYKNIDNLISNPKELEEMRKVLGNTTTTDDIAAYVEKRNLDYVKLKNIEDSGVGDVTIVNHKPGNYLKSAVGNNGMFDMTNPNIYKALIPAAIATGAATQEYQNGGQINNWIDKYKK